MGFEIIRLFDIAEARAAYPVFQARKPDVALEGAILEISYSSVFGEQWVLRSDTMVPQPK
jgi:hypothetical protein